MPTANRQVETELEKVSRRGFIQGVAWGISLLHRYGSSSDQMLSESGLRLVDFVNAGVEGEDLRRVKAAARLGSVWNSRGTAPCR